MATTINCVPPPPGICWNIARLPKVPTRDTDVYTKIDHYLLPFVKNFMIAAATKKFTHTSQNINSSSHTSTDSDEEGTVKSGWSARLWFHEPGFLRALPQVMSIRSSRDSRSEGKKKLLQEQQVVAKVVSAGPDNEGKEMPHMDDPDSVVDTIAANISSSSSSDKAAKKNSKKKQHQATKNSTTTTTTTDTYDLPAIDDDRLLADGTVTIDCLTEGDAIQLQDLSQRYPYPPDVPHPPHVSKARGGTAVEEEAAAAATHNDDDVSSSPFRIRATTLTTNDAEWIRRYAGFSSATDAPRHECSSPASPPSSPLSSSLPSFGMEGMVVLCDGGPSRLKKKWWTGLLQWWWSCPRAAAVFIMVHLQRVGTQQNMTEIEALLEQLKLKKKKKEELLNGKEEESEREHLPVLDDEDKQQTLLCVDVDVDVDLHPEVYNCGRYYQCISVRRYRHQGVTNE